MRSPLNFLLLDCTCVVLVCGEVAVLDGVRICCEVWVLRGPLFSAGVEVREHR